MKSHSHGHQAIRHNSLDQKLQYVQEIDSRYLPPYAAYSDRDTLVNCDKNCMDSTKTISSIKTDYLKSDS